MGIAENYLYNAIYQLISLLIPFITVPYVSRVLGVEGIGTNTYVGSILQYFLLLGSLSLGLYATRSIAYVKQDKECLSKTFWSIFYLQLCLCLVSFCLYISFILLFIKNYRVIFIVYSLNLISAAIDINWLFMGIEEFKKLILRSAFFKVMGTVSVFIFVTNSNDLWKYAAISAASVFFGQIVMWFYIYRTVDNYKVGFRDIIAHLKPSLKLFLPQIAIQVYLVLNKTLMGLMANKQEVGLYESADKIIRMSLAVLTAAGGVMLPRIASCFAMGNDDKIRYYIYSMLNFVSYMAIPMVLGLAGISSRFVVWFFGIDFIKCNVLLIIMSPLILIISLSNVMGYQYLIPTKRTSEFTVSVTIGTFVSIVLNLLLIKMFYSVGAAISIVITELAVTISQAYMLRKEIKLSKLRQNIIKYCSAALVMFTYVLLIGYLFEASAKTTFTQVFGGILIYISTLFILKSDINNYIFNKIFGRLLKKIAT